MQILREPIKRARRMVSLSELWKILHDKMQIGVYRGDVAHRAVH